MNDEEIAIKALMKYCNENITLEDTGDIAKVVKEAIVLARASTAEHYKTELQFYISQNAELTGKLEVMEEKTLKQVLEWLEKNVDTEGRYSWITVKDFKEKFLESESQ